MNGADLPPQHGYPLRLVVPGWYGMASVKWLSSIKVVTKPFDGFQQAVAYRYQQDADDAGTPVTWIKVRVADGPAGHPGLLHPEPDPAPGPVMLTGRAWSGEGAVQRVDVGIDGKWAPAHLEHPAAPFAWCAWSLPWVADPGEHELSCRATDATGAMQPLEQAWNYQGMGNNVVQRIRSRSNRRPGRASGLRRRLFDNRGDVLQEVALAGDRGVVAVGPYECVDVVADPALLDRVNEFGTGPGRGGLELFADFHEGGVGGVPALL